MPARVAGLAAASALILATAARAQDADVTALREEIAELREQQAQQIEQIRRQTDERVRAIEDALARLQSGARADDLPVAAAPVPRQWEVPGAERRLSVSGDFRLRYERTSSATEVTRNRGVVRGRLAARYELASWLTVGGRLATGDADDPNSTDVTLSDFADDLAVSLDQAYASMQLRGLQISAGKIPNPFVSTELVWDGDVNPHGVSGVWSFGEERLGARLAGLYFIVNESASGPESVMRGMQASLEAAAGEVWTFELAGGYYNYRLQGILGADAGDIRSNLLAPGGQSYLSDFRLVDLLAAAEINPAGSGWPLRVVANHVRNRGAARSADSGYSLDVLWGRAAASSDVRLGYGYSTAEADAVLAAFSHDNTPLATNYRQHALSIDYVIQPNILVNGTWYRFRSLEPGLLSGAWGNRLRLNLLARF
jgi:hypothetical protein